MQILPFTSTAAGRWIAAQVTSPTFHGVALVNLSTNEMKPLDKFASGEFQALGSYDGRVAVWKEFHSTNGLDQFSVKMWSAATGRVTTVGGSHVDSASGQTYPSPWTEPVLGEGHAAWVEGTDFSGRGRLVVIDTTSGRVRIASSGHPGGSLLIYGHKIVWGESVRPGAKTSAMAMSLTTGRPSAAPPALSAQRGGSSFATDGAAISWVGANHRTLYYSADGVQPGRLLVRLAVGGFNPPSVVHDGVVLSVDSDGVLAVSASGASSLIVRDGGSVTGTKNGFIVGRPAAGPKSSTAESALAEISPSLVILPACAPGSGT